MNLNHLKGWVMSCAVLLTLGVAGSAHAGVSDAWISTKVKMALMNSPEVSGTPIDVDTDYGRVTLHGRVPNGSQKLEAGRIARAGKGVVSVRNLLQVIPNSRRKLVAKADDRIKEDVSDALKAEPALANSSIHPQSVTKGVVLLDGKAATLSDHLLALEVAADVPGVRRVASEVQSPDEFTDREIWNDMPADAAAANNPSSGNRMTDGWITTQVKTHFMTDADVPAGDINVDTHRGAVTLFGAVPSAAIADKAKTIAGDVSGVKSVNSELRVVAASKKKAAMANDEVIAKSLRQRINDAKFVGADIKVEVKAGTARLTGKVQSGSDRYAAMSLAHATTGVRRVENDLGVEAPQTTER